MHFYSFSVSHLKLGPSRPNLEAIKCKVSKKVVEVQRKYKKYKSTSYINSKRHKSKFDRRKPFSFFKPVEIHFSVSFMSRAADVTGASFHTFATHCALLTFFIKKTINSYGSNFKN